MHEFSVAQSIIENIKDAIGSEMLPRVNKIFMEIGKLSGISIESLEFSLQVLLDKKGQEVLSVKEIEPEVRCSMCKKTFTPEDMIWICPYCQNIGGDIIKGNELKILEVEVSDEDQGRKGHHRGK